MKGTARRERMAVAIGLGLVLATMARAQVPEPPRKPQETLTVIYSLRVGLEMETQMLGGEMETYLRLEGERQRLAATIERLYDELNDQILDPGDGAAADLEAKDLETGAAEQEEIDVRRRLRASRHRMRQLQLRIEFLRARLSDFRDQLPEPTESLTGIWEVTYMPSGGRGYFRIQQNGTLLGGDYVLDGGWTGSLQGTFVNGKVFLQRIDSRLGRSSEIEGFLSSDGKSIRGSWQNFELSGPGPSSGSWMATKRDAPADAAAGP